MNAMITSVEAVYPSAPTQIQKALHKMLLTEVHIGCSDTHVYRASDGERNVYLKTQSVSGFYSFAHNVEILGWLRGRLPVPEVLEFARDADNEYLVLSEVAGMNCVEALEVFPPGRVVELLAEGLRMVHAVEIAACPFDERLAAKLRKGRENVLHNLVYEDYFDEERQGMTGGQVLERLKNHAPAEDGLVFNHGDYCLPNIMIQGGTVSGFIDLDRAGVSDRYNDLAIASRSIMQNIGTEFEPLFFQHYGIDKVDLEKIGYYRMMDELF